MAAMKKLAVLGHPVAHSRSPAMQTAALAELGLGGGVELRGDRRRPRRLRAPGPRAARTGIRRRQRHRSPQGRGAGGRRHPHRDRARDRRRQHAELRGRRDPGRQHRRRRPAGGAAGFARGRQGAGARRRRRRPRGRLGAAARGCRGRRLEPDPAALQPTSARSSAAAPSRSPTPAAYDLIVNSTAVGLRGEDPFEELPLGPAAFVPGQVVVDMVYGARADRAAGGGRGGRGGDGGRDRGPRPAGGALAARSGPAARRRSTRCAPPPAPEPAPPCDRGGRRTPAYSLGAR